MDQFIMEHVGTSIEGFRLPRYHEIPNVGLYLEQITKYISDCLAPLTDEPITGSMISNYVKRGLIANPIRKQYDREQIAYLIYIAIVKSVLSLDHIRLTISIQRKTYPAEAAYNYFCSEFENLLDFVFGRKSTVETIGTDSSGEKNMLRNTIITVAHKVYLDKLLAELSKQEELTPGKKR